MILRLSVKIFTFVCFVILAMFMVSKGVASEQQDVYKFKVDAFWGPEYHATKNAVLPSLRAIEEKSNGRIKFDIYYAQSLAKADGAYEAVSMGVVDIYWFMGPNYEPGSMIRGSIFSLPFALPMGKDNVYKAADIMHEVFIKDVKQEIIPNVEVCGWAPLSGYRFMTVPKIEKAEDLKALRLRSSGGYHDDIVKAVGAIPVFMAPGEIYEALSRGILQGVFHTYAAQYGWGTYEPMNYSTDLTIATFPFYTIVNKNKLKALPEDLQKLLCDTFKEYAPKASISYYNDEEEHFPVMGLEEIVLPQEEKDKIMNATIIPVWKKWINECEKKGISWKPIIRDLAQAWKNQSLTPPETWEQFAQ